MQRAAESTLGPSVLATDSSHDAGPSLGIKDIGHGR